jgi:hypothetical protein
MPASGVSPPVSISVSISSTTREGHTLQPVHVEGPDRREQVVEPVTRAGQNQHVPRTIDGDRASLGYERPEDILEFRCRNVFQRNDLDAVALAA